MSIFKTGGAGFDDFSKKINWGNKGFEYGRPVYGSLSIGGTQSRSTLTYGLGVMTLNSELKGYTTYTPTDSYNLYKRRQYSINPGIEHAVGSQDNLNPIISYLNLPQYNDLIAGRSPDEYIEWQSHTPILFKDVNEIFTNCPDYETESKIKKFSKKIGTTYKST